MSKIAQQIARSIMNRLPTQNQTGVVWAIGFDDNTVAVQLVGGAVAYGLRYVTSYTPVIDDVVAISRDARGMIITGKLAVTAFPETDEGYSELYTPPRLDIPALFTGTWKDGVWQTNVGNECRFGEIDGVESMGVAYYGRALQGSSMFSSDSYFLSIVRLPSPGRVPAKVTVGLVAGFEPTTAGPSILDTITGLPLTGAGMGDQAESLNMQSQGWEDRFRSGEAGGIALIHDATEPDHLTRVAGTYGCSMNVTGYPAWVL